MKFSIEGFFSKCGQIRSFLRIWSHLLKKSLMENYIFCAVYDSSEDAFMKTFNIYATMRKKFVKANEVLYLSMALRKTILKISELESILKKETNKVIIILEIKKKFCSNSDQRERKIFSKIN